MADKYAKANSKVYKAGFENGGLKPPGLPPKDLSWPEQREEAGLAPPSKPPAQVQKILRPRPTRRDKGTTHKLWGKALEVDRKLTQADWMKTYEAYQRVGTPYGLMRETGLREVQVRHLLDVGIKRLGLPAIHDHALDYAEVNKRIQEMGGDPGGNQTEDNFKFNLPEVQDAVIDRAAREAAGAQQLLQSSMAAGSIYNSFLGEIGKIIQDPEGGFSLPEKVGPKLIQALIATGDRLASTLDKAVRLSRLTAGEPETNIAIEVGVLVGRLDPESMRRFAETGQIPPELRGRLSTGKVVEAESVQLNVPGDDDE